MIDVKTAVQTATAFLLELMGADSLSNILLEEVELSDDEHIWCVTLSALLPEPIDSTTMSAIAVALGSSQTRRRVYKVFSIDAETGKVKSMKIRQVRPTE